MLNPRIDEYGTTCWVNRIGELHRDDGPAQIYPNGTICWWQHGKRHRDDGPAEQNVNGNSLWYQHGKKHREDGPAIEWPNGRKSWCLDNIHLSFDDWLNQLDITDEDKVMMKLTVA
jgi:hypothetical protein